MPLFAFRVNAVVPDPPLLKSAPATEIVPRPDPVIEVAVKAPPKVLAPRVRPLISVNSTLLAPLLSKLTAPVKSLFPAPTNVIAPAPPLNVATPAFAACVIVVPAACVIPTAVTVSVPVPTDELPKMIALASLTATLLASVLIKLTAPVKSLSG